MALLLHRGCTAPVHPGPTAQRYGLRCASLLRAQRCGQPRWLRSQHRPQQRSCSATATTTGLRELYPAPRLLQSGLLEVEDGHSVYVEVLGNPTGVPALFIHGGPGAGCYPNHARFFDPAHYKIILMDQRGCGRSVPRGCLAHNTTSALVDDIEDVRRHLGISQWLLLGGSWGVALALAYAQAYPEHILGLILRGVCLMRPEEIHWMYGGGAAALKPLSWEQFTGHLLPHERANPLLGYYKRLLSADAGVRDAAAQAWMRWEMAVCNSTTAEMYVWDGVSWGSQQMQQQQPPRPLAAAPDAGVGTLPGPSGRQRLPRGATVPAHVLAGGASSDSELLPLTSGGHPHHHPPATDGAEQLAPLDLPGAGPGLVSDTSHSWVPGLPLQGANLDDPSVQQLIWRGLNHMGSTSMASAQALLECHYSVHGAFLLEAPLLQHMERVQHIPAVAVQGQLDFVCPPSTAVALHKAWPSMELRLVPGAGHSMYDPAIKDQLVRATDRMRSLRPVSPVAAS